MHAKSGGSSGEPPDFLFIPAACRSRKDLPRSAGGRQGAEHGQPSAGRRRRSHGHGRGVRGAGDGGTGTGTGAGCGAAGAGCGAAGAEHGRRGRGAQDAKRGTRGRGRGHGHGGTGCRTQNTGYWPRAAEHGKRGHGAQETGHRRRGTSPRAWTAARLHTPARPRNNLPGPFTAGRLPPRAAATCRAYESESRRCRRARRTCCCRAAPRPT